MGYGARALQALNSFYSGEYFNLDENLPDEPSYPDPSAIDKVRYSPPETSCELTIYQSTSLLTDLPTVRAANAMPPLLQRLTERKPEALDYLGVSYGLTPQLLRYDNQLFDLIGPHLRIAYPSTLSIDSGNGQDMSRFTCDKRRAN